MVTPTRKCGSVFFTSLSVFLKYHNKECVLTKFEQFSKYDFGVISSQCLTIYPYTWN